MLVPVLIASLGIKFAGLDIAPVTGSAKWGLWLAVAWLAIGVGLALYLKYRRPDTMAAVGRLFVRGDAEPAEPVPAPVAAGVSG